MVFVRPVATHAQFEASLARIDGKLVVASVQPTSLAEKHESNQRQRNKDTNDNASSYVYCT